MKPNSTIRLLSLCTFILGLLTGPTGLLAQQTDKIQLLDQSTQEPIVGATYHYGTQSGLSDQEGYLKFNYLEGTDLIISHLSYGKWTLYDQAVQAAILNGTILKEEMPLSLYPITVIALRQKTTERETLRLDYEDKMAHDGASILNQTAAINSIRKSGNYGFDPVLRGFKYDQLNVVINGAQSATAACPNRMDPPTSQIAPNMMNRIEILKGPHALRYGSALGGTINFVPTAPKFSDQAETYGRLSGGYEGNGNIFRSEGMIGFSGRSYDLGVFGSWSEGNDYKDGDDNTVPADFSRGSFGANLGFKLQDRQQLTISITRNLARDADFPALLMDLREDDTWMFNARHDIDINKGWLQSWNTTVYGTLVDHLMNNFLKNLDPRMVNAETAAKTRTYGGRTEGVWKQSNAVLFAGADLRVEEAEGSRVREFLMGPDAGRVFTDNAWQDSRITKSGLFGEYHLMHNSLQFVFSGRLEVNNAQISDGEEEFTNLYPDVETTQVNPSLSIGGINNFHENFSVGLWLARAQRSGSLTERFINYFPVGQDPFEILGNPQLNPEVNNQVDLTLEYRTSNTSVSVDIFASFLQDYISSVIDTTLTPRLPNSPGVRQVINISEAFKTGFELGWTQQLWRGLQHQLSVAYTYGQDRERNAPLPEIAPLDFRYTLVGNYLGNKLHPKATLRHVLDQNRNSEEFRETTTPGFTTLDVTLSYQFNPYLSVTAGAQNIFDVTYYEHLNRSVRGDQPRPINAPGRNIFMSLTLDLR